MRERTRQRLLADTGTSDESLPVTNTPPPQRRKYAVADLSSSARGNMADSDFAVPGKRKLPIHDADHVRAAIARFNQTEGLTSEEKATAKARIRAAAKKFGVEIGDDSPVAAEAATALAPVLMLEASDIQILAEGSENDGVMRVRVPWYAGNSVARIKGFTKPLYFPTSILAETAAKAQKKIDAKMPGLTSYARHAHSETKSELPAGEVVALEVNGNRGYATIDVNSTRWGQDIQALARAGQLRATSLRSPIGGYEARERKVNGDLMLEVTSLDLDGIDFAPDGAAMPTYGVEVLAAEAAVEPAPTNVPRRNTMDDVTVDGLRAEFPQVVAEIEKPLRDELAALKAERETAIQAEITRKRDEMIEKIASQMPNPDEARPLLLEACKDAKSEAEVSVLATPLLLEALAGRKVEPPANPVEKLRQLWGVPGAGRTGITAESTTDEEPNIRGFAVPAN